MTVDFFSSNNGNYSATRTPTVITHVSYVPKVCDVVVAWFGSTVVSAITTPTALGWFNPLGGNTVVASDAHTLACLYRLITPAEETAGTNPSWTVTNLWNANATGGLVLEIYRGADPANPLDVAASTFNSGNTVTPHVLAGLTPRFSGSVVGSTVCKHGTGTYTPPTGWTQWSSNNVSTGMSALTRDAKTVGGTAIANTNITPSAGDEYASITVALRDRQPVSAHKPLSDAVRRSSLY